MELIYLDYLSANPLLPEVQEAMIAAIRANHGNPSSPHQVGDLAAEVLEKARSWQPVWSTAPLRKRSSLPPGGRSPLIRPSKEWPWPMPKKENISSPPTSNTMLSFGPCAGCG